jgi:hypothetical protein
MGCPQSLHERPTAFHSPRARQQWSSPAAPAQRPTCRSLHSLCAASSSSRRPAHHPQIRHCPGHRHGAAWLTTSTAGDGGRAGARGPRTRPSQAAASGQSAAASGAGPQAQSALRSLGHPYWILGFPWEHPHPQQNELPLSFASLVKLIRVCSTEPRPKPEAATSSLSRRKGALAPTKPMMP